MFVVVIYETLNVMQLWAAYIQSTFGTRGTKASTGEFTVLPALGKEVSDSLIEFIDIQEIFEWSL